MTQTALAERHAETDSGARPAGQVDFDLHGIVGLRLIDAAPGDVRAVERQVGPLEPQSAGPARERDITIRFVDRLRPGSAVRSIGTADAGFTDDAFLLLPDGRRRKGWAQVPLESVGGPCEIVCESGISQVPLLVSIVHMTVLEKGYAPVHASACVHGGTGLLATGWTGGGKTGLLLACMARGAQFVSDDAVYVGPDGRTMYGLWQSIHLKDRYLAQLPQYRARVPRSDRARMRAVRMLQSAARLVPAAVARRAGPARLRRRMGRLLEAQRAAGVSPGRLFGGDSCVPSGPLDKLLLVLSHDRPEVVVEQADPREIARRMVFSSQHELMDLKSCYLKFRFAFPGRPCEAIETAEERQLGVLLGALAGKDAYVVRHPDPACLSELYAKIQPVLERRV